MRDPFPYESNVSLIRNTLVPDPILPQEWERVLEDWYRAGKNSTLLEHLAKTLLSENELLDILGNHLGVQICRDPVFREADKLDAIGHMLHNHGFRILAEKNGIRYLTGGLSMNPDLSPYLGTADSSWEWILVSPLRHQDNADIVKEEPAQSSTRYGLSAWLEELISSLWSNGAQDIHFERDEDNLTIRVHNAREMQTVGVWSDNRANSVTRLLCTWAGLTNWDRNSFVDGRLTIKHHLNSLELRISIVPTVNGESIVLRAPSASISHCNLKALGLPNPLIEQILDAALHDPGLIICTGPTGSGKTTTLYGILHELKHANLKILTIEDPVEQKIDFAVQSSVNVISNWTFDRAIHAYLRQDPDLIMIGEIRDGESAEAACRAALTGHCVITSMHAGSDQTALQRLSAWGIPKGLIKETVRLIINQRLEKSSRNKALSAMFRWRDYKDTGVSLAT